MYEELINEGIEYVGKAGITQSCIDGILRYLQFDRPLREAIIISYQQEHGFLLYTEERHDIIVIRAGFGSGYAGEGSAGFSYILSLFEEFDIDLDEREVPWRIFQKLNRGQLTHKDLGYIDDLRPVRPMKIWDYMIENRRERWMSEKRMPIPIPLKLIDGRLRDLVINFWEDPDARIMTGFKRLEDSIRSRTGSNESGAKLFQVTFMGEDSILKWEGLTPREQAARADLFKSAYGSFRNPRAHKELDHSPEELLSEFLTLNHLFRLDRDAKERFTEKRSPG